MSCDIFSDGAESGDLTAWSGNTGAGVTTSSPHSGTYAIDISSETDTIYKDVGSRTKAYISFWWKPASGWTGTAGSCITVSHSTTVQSFLFLYASDNSVMHYTGVTWKAGSSANVITGSWQHFEWWITIADSGGISIVDVDGENVINFTGDTRGTGTYSDLDRVRFGRIGSFSNSDSWCYIDDVCIGSEQDLVISNSTHSQTAGAPILTCLHNLSVANSSHAISSDVLNLTQNHVISIDSSSHSITSENLDLVYVSRIKAKMVTIIT